MPTSTEVITQYLPRHHQYFGSEDQSLKDKHIAQSNDTVVKTVDIGSLADISSPTSNSKRRLPIILAVIAGFVIIAVPAIVVPVVLTRKTTTTTTSSTSAIPTTTQYAYPSGISLLPPSASLLNISNPSSSSSYYNVSWLYYAQGSNTTITFAIQNNPSYTQIDDVSVLYGTEQLLCNGGFENASMICWQGANHLSTGNPHTGSYCYNDGVVGAPDYVWQTFTTVPGALLYISFWIAWGGSGGGVYTNVTIYP